MAASERSKGKSRSGLFSGFSPQRSPSLTLLAVFPALDLCYQGSYRPRRFLFVVLAVSGVRSTPPPLFCTFFVRRTSPDPFVRR